LRLRAPFSVAGNLQGVFVCDFDADVILLKTGNLGVDLPSLLILSDGKLCPDCALAELALAMRLTLSSDVCLNLSLALLVRCPLRFDMRPVCFTLSLDLGYALGFELSFPSCLDLCLTLRLLVDLADEIL
jgi:hypothetical protein